MISGSSVAVVSYLVVGNLPLSLVTLGATVLTAGVIGIVSYRIAGEVDQLVTEMEAIADGDLNREISSDRKDEVGQMFRTLDTTRKRLKSRIKESETQRENAEKRQQDANKAEQRAKEARAELNQLLTELDEELSTAMERAADGELTVRVDTGIDNDDLRSIAESFNQMVATFETTIGDIRSFADGVDMTSDGVQGDVGSVKAELDDIQTSMTEIATGTERQRDHLDDVAADLQQLSATVEEVASQTTTIAEQATETAEIGNKGRKEASQSRDQLKTSRNERSRPSKRCVNLSRSSTISRRLSNSSLRLPSRRTCSH
ncbi:HAMP domain-containing protein [Halovenus salina]|uniref:HAMP domain-containing protein n=1 Tax=Halovenus salina TaxID=1510225 RepID=A0ABD5WBJ4_9EURY